MKSFLFLFISLLLLADGFAQLPADCQVKKITRYTSILRRGGNPAYKPSGDTIVYQKELFNLSSFVLSTQIFISDTGMTMGRCLTCDTNTLPASIRYDKHKGNAQYYPSGPYILFTSENENGAHQPWNLPGSGADNDIFIMNIDGTQFWRLTNIPAGHAILHPAFSHDGTKLLWGEMYYSQLFPPVGQEYGLWEMKMADFAVVAGTPQISNIVSFAPRDSVWYETHAFSPDDRFIAFTSHEKDSTAILGDICIMDTADIGTSNFINLTNSPGIHDEHAHWSPDGNLMSWMRGSFVGGLTTYSSELYLMNANGSNSTPITHFTNSSFPEYIQDTVVAADHYWSPDGKRIYGFVHFIDNAGWNSELYQIEFMGPCGLNPSSTGSEISETGFNIFPNPANDELTISPKKEIDAVCLLEITDLTGRILLVQKFPAGAETAKVNLSQLPQGFYVCRITQKNATVSSHKILVQR